MKKSKKDRLFTAGLILMLLAGLSLLLYPSVSNYLNSVRQAQSILTYDNEVAALRQEDYQRLRQQAEEYNVSLLDRPSPYGLTDAQQTLYPTTLLAGGSDVMAYLEVPSIGVTLPICHGTETSTLQRPWAIWSGAACLWAAAAPTACCQATGACPPPSC